MPQATSIPTVDFEPTLSFGGGFELVELESLYERSPDLEVNPFSPHRVNFHHLVYIQEGEGSHFIDFNKRPYESGSFIFTNRHQVHAFDNEQRPKGVVLLMTQEFIDSIRVNIRFPTYTTGFYADSFTPVQTVKGELRESCELLLGEIAKARNKVSDDGLEIQLLLTTLLVKLHRNRPLSSGQRVSETDQQRLSRFLSLVETRFTQSKDAVAYAETIGISYKTLNQVCKQATQRTPKQLIDAHIVLEAKRRLAIEQIQVSQLAYEFGFDDVSNFVKYFKKHTLMTPSQFQQNLRS